MASQASSLWIRGRWSAKYPFTSRNWARVIGYHLSSMVYTKRKWIHGMMRFTNVFFNRRYVSGCKGNPFSNSTKQSTNKRRKAVTRSRVSPRHTCSRRSCIRLVCRSTGVVSLTLLCKLPSPFTFTKLNREPNVLLVDDIATKVYSAPTQS